MAWTNGSSRTSTPAWRRLRRTILERDNHQCQIRGEHCTSTATEVDHRVNHKAGGTDDPSNLTSTCHSCHLRKTQAESAKAQAARRARLKLPTPKHPGLK